MFVLSTKDMEICMIRGAKLDRNFVDVWRSKSFSASGKLGQSRALRA